MSYIENIKGMEEYDGIMDEIMGKLAEKQYFVLDKSIGEEEAKAIIDRLKTKIDDEDCIISLFKLDADIYNFIKRSYGPVIRKIDKGLYVITADDDYWHYLSDELLDNEVTGEKGKCVLNFNKTDRGLCIDDDLYGEYNFFMENVDEYLVSVE